MTYVLLSHPASYSGLSGGVNIPVALVDRDCAVCFGSGVYVAQLTGALSPNRVNLALLCPCVKVEERPLL